MLTKSDLQSFLQCSRKLWLEHHKPELSSANDASTYRRAVDGNIVGEKAREQLGEDLIWPSSSSNQNTAAEAAKILLASSPDKPGVEIPMVRTGLYARADALIPQDGSYILRETKAKSFPLKRDKITPDTPEEHHLNDVAIQAWVMEASGFPMSRAELNFLDNQWRYPGAGNYAGLFKQMNVTSEIIPRQSAVSVWFQQAENILSGSMPEVVTGKQCTAPYECPFLSFCEVRDPPKPEHPIDLLPDSAGKKLAKKLRETRGYKSILDPQPEELVGAQAELYRRIQAAHRSGTPILEPGSDAVMDAFAYPRYYLDFEGIDLPVPRWPGVRPYEQIPFQWSCHIERAPNVFEHREFLDLSGNDPSLTCIEKMCEVISLEDNGPIFVYYAPYERGRLEEFSIRHPMHSHVLQNYIGRLIDLLPIVKDYYYHPAMQGSFSIKKVLPVMAPDLNYANLEGVQDGTSAQAAYINAALDSGTSLARKTDLEINLRKYCRQDTWAMVLIAYFLARKPPPIRPTGM